MWKNRDLLVLPSFGAAAAACLILRWCRLVSSLILAQIGSTKGGEVGYWPTKDFGEYSVTSEGEGACGGGGNSFTSFAFGAGQGEASGGDDVRMRSCPCTPLDEDDDYCDGDDNAADGVYPGPSLRSSVARVVAPRSPARPASGPLELADLPGFEDLGAPPTLHEAGFLGDGVRMAVMAAELAEPYAAVQSVAGVELRDDGAVPLSPRVPGGCRDTRAVEMPESSLLSEVTVTWIVGGGLTVDETAVMHGRWDVLDGRIFDCASQPTRGDLDSFFSVLRDFEAAEGEVRYSDRDYVPADVDMFRSVAASLVLAAAVVAVIFCCAFVRDESDGTDVLSVLRERRNIRRQKISVEEFWREESVSLELT